MFALYILGLFGLSCLFGYAITRGMKPRTLVKILQNGPITLRGTGGVYRSRIIQVNQETFTINAPLHQDVHLALRTGEFMRIEAGIDDQVAIFRAEIIGRDAETHTFVLKPTTNISYVNRRIEPRNTPEQWLPCKLDGRPAILVEYSHSGAKVLTREKYSTGDLVRIETPVSQEPQIACILEVKIDSHEGRLASQLRLVYSH